MATNQNHHQRDEATQQQQALSVLDAPTTDEADEQARSERERYAAYVASIRQPDALPDPSTPDEAAPPVVYATAASYRKGVEIPISNGEWVRLRPISLLVMVRTGKLPNSLIGAARRMLSNQGRQQKADAPQDPKTSAESLELQDYLVTRLVTSMKVVMSDPDDCDEDEVSVAEMFESDKNRIVAFAMQGQKALAEFR